MKTIPNEARERISYNHETGAFVWCKENNFHKRLTGESAGTVRDGYLIIKLSGTPYFAHRIAWFLMTGEQPNVIDHINGNKLDNRFSNIRNVTCSENAKNHGKKINKSGLPCGVRLMPSGRFQARLICDKKLISLGTFNTVQEAEQAYKAERANKFKQYDRK